MRTQICILFAAVLVVLGGCAGSETPRTSVVTGEPLGATSEPGGPLRLEIAPYDGSGGSNRGM